MSDLKYRVIKNEDQYALYCKKLETLIFQEEEDYSDEIELLTLLIEKWDEGHSNFNDLDPVQLLKSLMKENNLRAADISKLLDLSKGTVSKMLHYQKGFSKNSIRKLSEHFKLSQEAFNRPYNLRQGFRESQMKNRALDGR